MIFAYSSSHLPTYVLKMCLLCFIEKVSLYCEKSNINSVLLLTYSSVTITIAGVMKFHSTIVYHGVAVLYQITIIMKQDNIVLTKSTIKIMASRWSTFHNTIGGSVLLC